MCHHARLIFTFLVETGFHHVGQAGLKLLTSGNPPTLASQSTGIIGVSHQVWPTLSLFEKISHYVAQVALKLLGSIYSLTSASWVIWDYRHAPLPATLSLEDPMNTGPSVITKIDKPRALFE